MLIKSSNKHFDLLDSLPQNTQDSFSFTTTKDFEDENSVLSITGSKSLMEAFCNHEELLLCNFVL